MKKLTDLKDKRYLIAVSGGPDSMALLDMARKKGVYLEVAHMNYHKRETADRDEKIVRKYCKEYKIRFHKKDFDENEYQGNFQDAARKARYDFFNELCTKNELDCVLIAHQKDDLIETYMMQKEKKLGVSYYGIRKENTIYGVKVLRPLLSFYKDELTKYCIKNNIEYGIDESNLKDDYTRNSIRHHKLDKLDKDKKDMIVEEINKKNEIKQKQLNRAQSCLNKDSYTVNEFLKIPYLKVYLSNIIKPASKGNVEEVIRQLKESKKCEFHFEGMDIYKEYGKIWISEPVKEYEYVFDSLKQMKKQKYEYFLISDTGTSFEGVTLSEDDFPVMIRNFHEGDQIMMNYGNKKVNRYFIDHKIPTKDRRIWPVMLNKKGEVILVPGLGCERNHYSEKHSIFVIKL